MDDLERLKIVLRHLIEHNSGHTEDYARWIELARNNKLEHIAGLITEASEQMNRAGEVLKKALEELGGSAGAERKEHHHR